MTPAEARAVLVDVLGYYDESATDNAGQVTIARNLVADDYARVVLVEEAGRVLGLTR